MTHPFSPKHLTLILLTAALLLTGCRTQAPTPTLTPTTAPTDTSGLRFSGLEGLEETITALYAAFSRDRQACFVDADEEADLAAGRAPEASDSHPKTSPTFLPGFTLHLESDSPEAADFLAFALSPDGQQALIEAGFLPDTLTLTDQAGQTVTIPLPVRRVLSAYGMATAMVYTVGGADRLVAASYLGARDPAGAAAMTAIDPRFESLDVSQSFSQSDFNTETAAALEPDLILAGARSPWLEAAAELGVPIVQIDAETPDRLKDAVLLIGQVLGPNTQARAEVWAAYQQIISSKITDQTSSVPVEERPVVLFTGTTPLRAASGEMVQADLIRIAGGVSASAELSGYWNDVNLEQIALWAPDVIIVPAYGGATTAAITDNPDWAILNAVREGQVYQMPKLVAPWDTPAPDVLLGIVWLAERLFPDQHDLTCTEEAAYFYQTFYDVQLPEETIDALCRPD
jgi:iron complex transport system substrate-binding protein